MGDCGSGGIEEISDRLEVEWKMEGSPVMMEREDSLLLLALVFVDEEIEILVFLLFALRLMKKTGKMISDLLLLSLE